MTRIIVRLPGVEIDNSLFSDGWQLSNLEGWWDSADPRIDDEPRDGRHGDYGQDDVFQSARYVTITGVFQSYEDPGRVIREQDTLTALHEAGQFEMAVLDGAELRATVGLASRIKWDVDYAPGCAKFEFTVKADDPRKYGPKQTLSTSAPTPGEGISDPIMDPISEGEPGTLGRVELVNRGTAPSEPMIRVTGGLTGGFELSCIETARVVRVTRPIPEGSVIDVNMSDGTVWIDQQSPLPATYIPVSEWLSVGPGETCTIQFTPLGVKTGNPTMSVEFAEASW